MSRIWSKVIPFRLFETSYTWNTSLIIFNTRTWKRMKVTFIYSRNITDMRVILIIDTQFITQPFSSAIITDGTSYIKHVLSSDHFSSVKGNIINCTRVCHNRVYKLQVGWLFIKTEYRIRCFIKREWFISTYRPCILYIWSLFVHQRSRCCDNARTIGYFIRTFLARKEGRWKFLKTKESSLLFIAGNGG